MKASEMTNQDLYDELWLIIYDDYFDPKDHERSVLEEAAGRLRKSTMIEAALNINVGMNNAAATITADLRRRLKVAEDALESGIFNLDAWVNGGRFAHTESDDESLTEMRNALAAIREEGGAK